MNGRKLYRFSLLIMIVACSTLARAEPATVVTDAVLYEQPSAQASRLQNLAAGSAVESLQRLGAWKKIQLPDSRLTGWVRSYQVRNGHIETTADNEQESGGFFSSLAALSRKASGLFSSDREDYSFQRTATIGVRGLSEEQIKNAEPDFDELSRLETYRSSDADTRSFARQGHLADLKLNHMPKSKQER